MSWGMGGSGEFHCLVYFFLEKQSLLAGFLLLIALLRCCFLPLRDNLLALRFLRTTSTMAPQEATAELREESASNPEDANAVLETLQEYKDWIANKIGEKMMYVSGETGEPSPETTGMVEEIVRQQVIEMVCSTHSSIYRPMLLDQSNLTLSSCAPAPRTPPVVAPDPSPRTTSSS